MLRFLTMHTRQLTAIIEREGDGYVALCLEPWESMTPSGLV